jgi:hypothetical protein
VLRGRKEPIRLFSLRREPRHAERLAELVGHSSHPVHEVK